MTKGHRRNAQDMDTLLRDTRFVPRADFAARLQTQLLDTLLARHHSPSVLTRMRAWMFSYPNGYSLREVDTSMKRSKLLTVFSFGVLAGLLVAFVGLVILSPPTGVPNNVARPTDSLPSPTSGPTTMPPPTAVSTPNHPFARLPSSLSPALWEWKSKSDFPALTPITTANAVQIQEFTLLDCCPEWVTRLAFSPQGRFLALDGILWDLETGVIVFMDARGTGGLGSPIAFSPDGDTFAIIVNDPEGGTGFPPPTIYLIDLATGEMLQRLEARPGHHFSSVAFTTEGSRLVSGGNQKSDERAPSYIEIWDPVTGEQLLSTVQEGAVRHLVVSPDGSVIATTSTLGGIYLWDANLNPLAKIDTFGFFGGLAISPTGTLLAYAEQATIRLWDLSKSTEYMALDGHTLVEGIAFSPDGSLLASVGQDGTLRLWEVSAGQELAALTLTSGGRNEWLLSVAFSPDSTFLVIGGNAFKEPVKFVGIPSSD